MSNLCCHLGNMAQDLGRQIHVDVTTGRAKDVEVMLNWRRVYVPGWEIR